VNGIEVAGQGLKSEIDATYSAVLEGRLCVFEGLVAMKLC
jgi:hypothetical protein